jgi:hypothetical protein
VRAAGALLRRRPARLLERRAKWVFERTAPVFCFVLTRFGAGADASGGGGGGFSASAGFASGAFKTTGGGAGCDVKGAVGPFEATQAFQPPRSARTRV